MKHLFGNTYENKTVLITGHTGFKGSWLTFWLSRMGAKVIGYSLPAPTEPNHFSLLNQSIISEIGDIRDSEKLNEVFSIYKPDIVFHLAAQSLVRYSYKNPIETYETNVMGTLKIFEACKVNGVKAIVNITSDKVYQNHEWVWGYRENDPLGGYDPYSSSKGCADILTASYRNSYFHPNEYKKTHNTLLATCRAGNVIGGGDWATDRLISDIMISVSQNKKVCIRNPDATRPWQHVLEPLSGYLLIGQKLLEEKVEFGEAWNFGPNSDENLPVKEVIQQMQKHWNTIDYEINKDETQPHEANLLKLDCSKANLLLQWKNCWNSEQVFEKTTVWYKRYYEQAHIATEEDLISYVNDATIKNSVWTK